MRLRLIIIHLFVICPAILTILIASSDDSTIGCTSTAYSKHKLVAKAIVNTNPLRRLRQLIRPACGNSNTIDSTTSVREQSILQQHPNPQYREHHHFLPRLKKRIQQIMGQSISTSQWYVYGRRHFTKTGYQRHIRDYNDHVQSCANIGRNVEGADGVDLDGKVVVITGYVHMCVYMFVC